MPASLNDNKEPVRDGCLCDIIPFCYLEPQKRRNIEEKLKYHLFEPKTVVINKDERYNSMYIVISGGFVFTDSDGSIVSDQILAPGSYFGERAAIFHTPWGHFVRSISLRPSSAWSLSSDDLVRLLKEHSPLFALALSSDLRHKQGIFDPFLAFRSFAYSAFHEPGDRPLDLEALFARYQKMKPALHPLVDKEDMVDYDGWAYALRRLPQNITRVYNVVCSRRIMNVLTPGDAVPDAGPSVISGPGKSIETDARRRSCWEVMPGKLFVLLRDLHSDYLDFLTCLCIHAIECKKIREKMHPIGRVTAILSAGLSEMKDESTPDKNTKITNETLSKIHSITCLQQRDMDGIQNLWRDGTTLQKLLDILIHHADFCFYLDKTGNAHTTTAEEYWSKRVRALATQIVGPFENSKESDLVVDIVSSNTHSVLNCLSPFIHSNREEIMAWGSTELPHLSENNDIFCETDRLYIYSREYLKAHPHAAKEAERLQKQWGIEEMVQPAFTGVSVQLYNLNKLKSAGFGFDDSIPDSRDISNPMKGKRHLLINIDYCFGQQGEVILRLLLLTFGKLVRSINIIGKAGGLVEDGQRGDILFPTHILDENLGGEMRAVDNSDLLPERLCQIARRKVHVGPIITVLGTVLQSEELLMFYNRLWHATGMEMEASAYVRAIEEAMNLGITSSDLRSRFLYYVSDTPLKPESSLASSMTLSEGVPPLYAVTRAIVSKVLKPCSFEEPVGIPNKRTGQQRWKCISTLVSTGFVRPTRSLVLASYQACELSSDEED